MPFQLPAYRPFVIVFVASLMFFYAFALVSIFNVLQPHLASSLLISDAILGLISSASFYIEIVFLLPAGPILDTYSVKRVLLITLFISIIGVVLTAFAHCVPTLLIARMLMAIAASFGFAGSVKLAVNWLPKKYLSQGITFIGAMGFLGGLIVQVPLTYSIAKIGWRYSLYGVSLVGLLILVLIYLIVKNNPLPNLSVENKLSTNNKITLLNKFKLAFFNKQNLFCGIYASLMNLPVFMLGAMWGIVYLTHVNTISPLAAATICTMIFLGTIIGCPLVGAIDGKFFSCKFIMKAGALLSLILILIIIFYPTSNLFYLMIAYFLLGLFTSTQMLSYPIVIENNSKAITSSATAVVSMLAMVGGAISQPLFGYISSLHSSLTTIHSYQYAIGILPCAFLLAFAMIFLIKD
jgi:MFS family permease